MADSAGKKPGFNTEGLCIGKNPVREALRAGAVFDTVYISDRGGLPGKLAEDCKKTGAVVKTVPAAKLDAMSGGGAHQGIIAVRSAVAVSTLDDIFSRAAQKGEPPLILIADGVEDPHNLGALIRSAECAGAHGVIVPRHRSAVLGATVLKSSAGAAEHIPVVKVTNLTAAVKELQSRGVWVYAADMDAPSYRECDLSGPSAIVVGSEGSGVSRLVKENCDGAVGIPMYGKINSLNVSVAGAVLLFEAAAQRHGYGKSPAR